MQRKIFPLLLYVMFSFTTVSAQSIRIGFMGGVGASLGQFSITSEDGDEIQGAVTKELAISPTFAIPLEIKFNEQIGIQVEPGFSQHRIKQKNQFNETTIDYTYSRRTDIDISLSQIEIPVLGKFSTGNEGFQFHVLAGPTMGIILGGDGKFKESGFDSRFGVDQGSFYEAYNAPVKIVRNDVEISGSDYVDFFLPTKRFNLNLMFGAGISRSIGKSRLCIDLRYAYGMGNLFRNAKNEDGGLSNFNGKANRLIGQLGILTSL